MRLLLVEDDYRLAEVVAEALSNHSYIVDVVGDGQSGWDFATREDYSVILLDIMLPDIDGISLCQRLRAAGYTVPVLMMTARDSSSDKVLGLDSGADDYVIKPVDLPELLARIRALIRRNTAASLPELTWGKLRLNTIRYEVTYNGTGLNLTPKEFALLELFLQQRQRVLSRRSIIDHLWPVDKAPGEETVKAHIKTLRQKLTEAGATHNYIETIRGVGYRLKPVDAS